MKITRFFTSIERIIEIGIAVLYLFLITTTSVQGAILPDISVNAQESTASGSPLPTANSATPTPTISPSPTQTAPTVTPSSTPVPILTPKPTLTPSPTETPILESSPTPTITPSPTPGLVLGGVFPPDTPTPSPATEITRNLTVEKIVNPVIREITKPIAQNQIRLINFSKIATMEYASNTRSYLNKPISRKETGTLIAASLISIGGGLLLVREEIGSFLYLKIEKIRRILQKNNIEPLIG